SGRPMPTTSAAPSARFRSSCWIRFTDAGRCGRGPCGAPSLRMANLLCESMKAGIKDIVCPALRAANTMLCVSPGANQFHQNIRTRMLITSTWVVLPVKILTEAKQRLSPGIGNLERQRLCRAMAEDVLEAISQSGLHERILVVTEDPEITRLAGRYRARIM